MKAFQGQGSYGAVYRAERGGFGRSEPGALKASLSLWNWRMEREVELLSRLNHPCIPRLLDRGGSQPPGSGEHPYFVMEWVRGTPLYAWAEQSAASGPQLCRVLAHLARALEAVHAAGAVHRDVKGDNVLVRLSDRLPVLIDFGSCHFAGAPQLTRQALPPMTPEYRSPQALLFLAAVGACVALSWHSMPVRPPPGLMGGETRSAAVGDPAPTEAPSPATEKKPLAQQPLPEPRPGQLRPDKSGRCPGHKQVPLNGGCWLDVSTSTNARACTEGGYVLFQGKCLGPALAPPSKPQPTSAPPQER